MNHAKNTINLQAPLLVFGGTFDPGHLGHVLVVKTALHRFPEARLMIVPTPLGPSTVELKPSAHFTFEQRCEILQILVEKELGDECSRVEISSIEIQLPKPHYTSNLLAAIKEEKPHCSLILVVGEDQWANFWRWHEPQGILGLASIMVIARPVAQNPNIHSLSEEIAAKLGLELSWVTRDQAQLVGQQLPENRYLVVVDTPLSDASSREIKKHLSYQQKIPENWLPKYILDKIVEFGKAYYP